jgi:membrane fusion protein, multidrug efflux system
VNQVMTSMEIMDMRRTWMWGALVATVVGLAGCRAAEADGADGQGDPAAFARVINVEVKPLSPERFVEDIRLTSVATANQDVQVAAEESGVIREFYVDQGDHVSEGDPIAKIDDRVLAAQVEQAKAASDLAAQTWDRRKRLWEEDHVGSEIDYLNAKYGAEQSAAALSVLQERLARTVIRAPFAGVLDERRVDVGAMVNPGQSVGHLVDLGVVKVVAGVPERYAADVHVGQDAVVTFDVLQHEPFRAKVRYVGSTVDPDNRTFRVEVVVPNPQGLIKPQMVANLSLTRRAVENAIVVPQDALVRVEDGYVAFVAGEQDGSPVAQVRPVELGPTQRNLVVIESGLAAGDRLIVVGQKEVENGDHIRIVGGEG